MTIACGTCHDHHASVEDVRTCATGQLQARVERMAQADRHECECGGSGVYYGAGYVENGVFKGFTGTCFRCGGKGYQTAADQKRNAYYDDHVRRIPS